VDNVFLAFLQGRSLPKLDLSLVGLLAAMAAIAGSGGLTNTAISAYTRDQGWGMGSQVGAVPSVVGGHALQLAHVGTVFHVTAESLRRFRGWIRHVWRDQLVVWMPACFVGLALPSMLSIQFLPRGTQARDWTAAAMTADGVAAAVGPRLGPFCWLMTLFCGFLVLAPSAATTADGILRRWVDVFWTGSAHLRRLDPHSIRYVYFAVLCGYAVFGLLALAFAPPGKLIVLATTIYNYALGVSCWHTLVVNLTLLPRELRPGWPTRVALAVAGFFFTALALITTLDNLNLI
jgi:hypothetical protein